MFQTLNMQRKSTEEFKNVFFFKTVSVTCLVVQEADGAVLMCSDGDRLRRVADYTVDQLTACIRREMTQI